MAVRLFNLRNVPEDEADEVRQLLERHGFDFYETPAGSWGVSMPSFWLRDESQLAAAKAVIADYQRERAAKARELYERQRAAGELPTVLSRILAQPLRFIAYLLLIAFFLYISISPFINLGQ